MKIIDGIQYVTMDTLKLYASDVLKMMEYQKIYFKSRNKPDLISAKVVESRVMRKTKDILGNQLNIYGDADFESESIEE